jgi:Family of unknown function (DUF6220)
VTGRRRLFAAAAAAYLVGIVIQVLLAGAAVFELIDFVPHAGLGWLLGSAPLLLIPLAIVARAPLATISLTVVLALDAMLQPELALAREDAPVIAAFHPVNAFLLFWLALLVARRAVAFAREATPPVARAASAVPAPTPPGGD